MKEWKVATLLKRKPVSYDVFSLIFEVDGWLGHTPGQYCDIRLTSEDGYQAQRSYSVASLPSQEGHENLIEFGVQLLDDGEVSPYLVNQLLVGDQIEIKGPLGGHFIWDTSMPGPLLLIAGGSGVVPFISMLRHYTANLSPETLRAVILLFSVQSTDRAPFYYELNDLERTDKSLRIVYTFTQMVPSKWTGYQRRIDKEMLREVFGEFLIQKPMIYICGNTSFVESVANNMVNLGFQSHFIKTERFGDSL